MPALTDLKTWKKVQELYYQRPKRGQKFPNKKIHPKTQRRDYLLSGLCECMFCRSSMHTNQNTRKDRKKYWRYYVCARKKARPKECEAMQVSAKRLDRAVIEAVNSKVLTIDFVSDLVQQVNFLLADKASIEAKIAETNKNLKKLNRAIGNLIDSLELQPSPDLLNRLNQRENERNTEQRQLARLQAQAQQQSIQVSQNLILSLLTDMRVTLDAGEIKARQHILRQTV